MARTALAVALMVALGAMTALAQPVGFDDAITWSRMASNVLDPNAPPASDGTAHGSLGYTAAPTDRHGSNGVAGDFSGNDYITFSADPGTELDTNWPTGLTAFARVKFDSIGPSQEIVNHDGYVTKSTPVTERGFGLALFGGSARGLGWRLWSGTDVDIVPVGSNWSSIAAPQAGVYYDAVGVFRPGASTELYIDGKLVGSKATSFTSLNNPATVDVAIGRRSGGGSPGYLGGDLESVALWNQPLRPGDVRRLTVGPLRQDNAAAWLRFGGNFDDSNGPPFSDATHVTGSSATISIVPAPGAPDHMGNGQAADFPGYTNSSANGPLLDLGLGASGELDIDGSNGFTVFTRIYPHVTGGPEIVCRDGYTGSGSNPSRSFGITCTGSVGPIFRVWSGDEEFRALAQASGYPADWVNNWHDVVGVFRPGEAVELWLDGELVGMTTSAVLGSSHSGGTSIENILTINTPSGVPIYLGRRFGGGTSYGYYNGLMESVAFWAYDLTPSEIQPVRARAGDDGAPGWGPARGATPQATPLGRGGCR